MLLMTRTEKVYKALSKEFQEVTVMNEDGYPKYRHRNTGDSISQGPHDGQ